MQFLMPVYASRLRVLIDEVNSRIFQGLQIKFRGTVAKDFGDEQVLISACVALIAIATDPDFYMWISGLQTCPDFDLRRT